ncbi:MAG: FtsX-like permease family protein [Spirochaetales bacterium]|jgi:putative ABC transport system permease protein|nr:FtsX-like permease family protein [Spirochaetales bacterium]
MNLLKIAYRNVSRQKRRSNLLALAIAFGVMIIVLVNSLTTGLVENTQNNFETALGGHIYITGAIQLESGKTANRIGDPEVLDAVIPQFDQYIADYQKRSMISGTYIFRSKSVRGLLYGVHWEEEKVLADTLEVVEGSLDKKDEPGMVVLPKDVADELGVLLNEQILMSFSTVTGQANVGEFTIIALTKDTSGLGFSAAYANIGYINELVGLEADEYQSLNLILNNINLINPVTAQLKTAIAAQGAPLKPEPTAEEELQVGMGMGSIFGGSQDDEPWEGTRFEVANLNDYMDMVTQVVAILNGIAMGMFFIMLLITMVGLVNTFRMIMIERVKEIGTIRSVGMLRKDVAKLFILEGLILALRGAVFGIIAALIVGFGISLIPFPDGSNFAILLDGGHISVPIVPLNMILVTAIIALITLAAVWSPARKAARLQPADALRY